MKNTNIQWCHSTVNPVMGCDGCELWPPVSAIRSVLSSLLRRTSCSADFVETTLASGIGDRTTSELYCDREEIMADLTARLQLDDRVRLEFVDVIRQECKCYAGMLGTFRAGHAGYAEAFELSQPFPGRMSKAANWGPPVAREIVEKPWLRGLPRLIFISDMGDALSKNIPFQYLDQEIIRNVVSASGQRHIWLWLTKRPGRMAEFGHWLANRGVGWPDNLMAMTTVTQERFAQRVDELRNVPSKLKGLSLEPLFGPLSFDFAGIDWVILGGGSDVLADPFDVEWAMDIHQQCRAAGIAFFFKQAGRNPFYHGESRQLKHHHGGDWNEWPVEWRVREFPKAFHIVPTRAISRNKQPELTRTYPKV
jgi:protein gp37